MGDRELELEGCRVKITGMRDGGDEQAGCAAGERVSGRRAERESESERGREAKLRPACNGHGTMRGFEAREATVFWPGALLLRNAAI
jgi:hypothetical protein